MLKRVVAHFKNVPPLTYATGLFVFATMGSRPLVPLYSITLGISAEELGLLVAMFALIPLGLAIVVGKRMDWRGTHNILLISVLLAFVGLILPFVLPGRSGIYLSQLVAGTGFTTFILAAQKRVSAGVAGWERERDIAVFSMGVALGGMLGPLAAGLIGEAIGIEAAFGMLALIVLPALLFLLPLASDTPANAKPPPRGFDNPLKVFGYNRFIGRAFLISSLILLGKDMYIAYFPIYAHSIGISASMIGAIIGIHNSGSVLARYFLLTLVRTFGKHRVVVTSILFSGVVFLFIPFIRNVALLTLIALAIGMGLGIGQPLSISTTINLSPATKVGEVLGLRLTCNRLTQVVTPLGFGSIALLTGVVGTFWVIGAILIVGCTRLSIPDDQRNI